jgi:hypothetical protein
MKKIFAVSIIAMMLFSSCGKSHNLLEPREPIEAKQTELIESHNDAKLKEDFNYVNDVNRNGSAGVAFLCSVGAPLLAFLDLFTSDKPTSTPKSTEKP